MQFLVRDSVEASPPTCIMTYQADLTADIPPHAVSKQRYKD